MTSNEQLVRKAEIVSFLFILLMFVMSIWLRLASPFLAVLFSYFALKAFYFKRIAGKWLAIALYLLLMAGITYSLTHFVRHTIAGLPEIVDKAIPSITKWAGENDIVLPFTDYDSLKALGIERAKDQVSVLGQYLRFARGAAMELVLILFGCVAAVGLFLRTRFELDRRDNTAPGNFYSLCCDRIAERFTTFFQSFSTVMGAQIAVSLVNTILTTVFVLTTSMPHPVIIVGVTFLCGLLPIVGNLISNAIIVIIGFTVSPKLALTALLFLIIIHKLEYFLNSRIIGERIRNPMWLTLLGLVVGERLMGIPGMILAPVVLHYLKLEGSKIEITNKLDVPVQPAATPQGGCAPDKG